MTASSTQKPQSVQYPSRTVTRAEVALFCSSFQLTLFKTMQNQSVSLQEIAGSQGYKQRYTKKILSEGSAEWQLMWLIQVGLLRREVDGQGITDSFRLTPLGREIVEKWEEKQTCLPTPSIWQQLLNRLTRWLTIFS